MARGNLEPHDAKDMHERAAFNQHGGGFSGDAGLRTEASDRAGLERLLRYSPRPLFASARLKQRGADLVYSMAHAVGIHIRDTPSFTAQALARWMTRHC